MGTNCYRPGYERGPWFEILWLRKHIAGREARGEDTTWYRNLYFSWLEYPEYAKGDEYNRRQGFYGDLTHLGGGQGVVSVIEKGMKRLPTNVTSPEMPSLEVVMKHPGGRPKKDGEYSRVTDWRRRKEQGVMV
jgi:hypothetical protein